MRTPELEEGIFTAIGLTSSLFTNWSAKLPFATRLPRHLAFSAAGFFLGHALVRYRKDKVLRREVWIWDYVNKHPEDFPELQQSTKFKDVLRPWHPVR